MKKFDYKKLIPYVVAILAFYVVSIVYFAPIFLEGKDLRQGDVTSYIGWADDVRQYTKETGEVCYWSNAMFGGMPTNVSFPQPTNSVFKYIARPALGFLHPNTSGAFFAYMIGFFVLMIVLGCSPWLSIIGSIAYALCSYNLIIIDAGHVSKAYVMATIAPVLAGIIMCYRKKYVWGVVITLIATGLNVYWNHQQISYYLILVIAFLAIVYFIYAVKEHTLVDYFKSSAILVVVALLAVAPAIDKLVPTYDYSKETMRGGAVLQSNVEGEKESGGLDIDYAYQWSYGKAETITLLIPNFYGASSHYNIGKESALYEALRPTGQAAQISKQAPMYWGDQPFTSGPVYIGAIICFLFLFGMIVCKGPDRWWILVATIFTVILSWGRNLPAVNEWFFHNLPLYNKFRTPSMALVIPSVLMVMLAMMSVREVVNSGCLKQSDRKQFLRPLYISAGVTMAITLFFALFGGSLFNFQGVTDSQLPEWLHSALIEDRKAMLSGDAWRSTVFVLLGAVAMWSFIKFDYNVRYFYIALGLLILVDLWGVDKRFLNDDNFIPKRKAKTIEATANDQYILQDTDPDYRVLNLATSTFNESFTSYFHKSVGGYSPAKLRRYQDIIDYHISRKITPNVLNMLNTRYIIVPTQQGAQVQTNPAAMGNAWFVDEIQWSATPDEEINALYDADLHKTALVEEAWRESVVNAGVLADRDTLATIALTEYRNPGNLIYTTSSATPQFAVFSEVFYKTWKLYVDGEEAPLVRANYILRAAEIPAGDHTLEFRCVDKLYETTHTWSLIASIVIGVILLSLCGFGIYRELKPVKK